MKAIHLKETDLIAVVVPEHAIRATVYKSENDKYVLRWIDDVINIMEFQEEHILLGICTKDHIDFDVEPITNATGLQSKEIFLQMLKDNGILMVNPYNGKDERQEVKGCTAWAFNRMAYQDKWQQAESQLTPKVLILKKLK